VWFGVRLDVSVGEAVSAVVMRRPSFGR
jgi:hypothetical protein